MQYDRINCSLFFTHPFISFTIQQGKKSNLPICLCAEARAGKTDVVSGKSEIVDVSNVDISVDSDSETASLLLGALLRIIVERSDMVDCSLPVR